MSDMQANLDALTARLRAQKAENNVVALDPGRQAQTTSDASDEAVLEKCRASRNAAKFEALYRYGDVSSHRGPSEADFALLGILKFYTQDPEQLERLMRTSALVRPKWDTRRGARNFIRFNIEQSLKNEGETYDWSRNGHGGGRPIGHGKLVSSSSDTPVQYGDDDTRTARPEALWFHELGEPKPREYLIESVGVKGYPVVAFGAGGVAKSFGVLAAGIAIAGGGGSWLGWKVLEHGVVLYLDFELDVEEQHRRVRDLCAGLGVPVPKRLAYMSGVGLPADVVFDAALAFTQEHEAKAVIIDSMGLAMGGDMDKAKDVLAFHNRFVDPFRRFGVTPFIVDHEGKLATGEKRKDKMPMGSAFKTHVSRSVLQFQFEEYDKESSELSIRVRQPKVNLGAPLEPIGVRFKFEEKKVSISTYALPDEELLEEDRVPVRTRILAALKAEPATSAHLQQLTGASQGTIRNNLSDLVHSGVVEADNRRPKTYSLVSSSLHYTGVSSDDDTNQTPEERLLGLFEYPPPWMRPQLRLCRQDPGRHSQPLCSAVAAEVFGEAHRAAEVKPLLETWLAEPKMVVE